MKKTHIIRLFLTLLTFTLSGPLLLSAQELTPILIITGQNNHNWSTTTPVLKRIFSASGMFEVSITLRPDTLDYNDLKKFRLVVGNWNNWPDTSARWDRMKESAFERYVEEGGGTLFLHAGGSSFYGWQQYHKIAIGRWGPKTSHGPIGPAKVLCTESEHPILQGFNDFTLTDELWEQTEVHSSASVLAWAQKMDSGVKATGARHPAVMISQYGKGRCFYTIFGHDEKTLSDPNLQALLVRAAAWASRTPTQITGFFGTYQYGPDRKPHFHPLISPKGTILTAESPADHLWHMGLWFSWKYINGLNYWEYTGDPTHHKSEGRARITSFKTDSSANGTRTIDIDLIYHPWNSPEDSVMTENQHITISPPAKDGAYRIEYDVAFNALTDILLDRTPILGEPGGQSWGGYSGMSIRLNTRFSNIRYMGSAADSVPNGSSARWVACGFDTPDRTREQVILFDHPENMRYPSPWYCINDPRTPMYYFSPAILYQQSLKIEKGKSFRLRYSFVFPSVPLDRQEIENLSVNR